MDGPRTAELDFGSLGDEIASCADPIRIVKLAEALIAALPPRIISARTRRTYEAVFTACFKAMPSPSFTALSDLMAHPAAGGTIYKRRAALNYLLIEKLRRDLLCQAACQKSGDHNAWLKAVSDIGACVRVLCLPALRPQLTVGEGLRDPTRKCPAAKVRRDSNRRMLGTLPKRWRETLWEQQSPNSVYRGAVAVLWATGARSEEIVKGVQVCPAENGRVEITIIGAKTGVHGRHGQQQRTITIGGNVPCVTWLREQAVEMGGVMAVSVPSSAALHDAVRGLSERAWPTLGQHVTPKIYRHAFAAIAKDQLGKAGAAAALGHCQEDTQSYYGTRNQASSGGLKIAGVVCSRPVKASRHSAKACPTKTSKCRVEYG